MSKQDVPTKDHIEQKLRQLISGEITPEQVSDWAGLWIIRFEEVENKKIRRALEILAMADMPTTDREYLYGLIDYKAWLSDFMR